jgi:ribose transport system substrate-binding protein
MHKKLTLNMKTIIFVVAIITIVSTTLSGCSPAAPPAPAAQPTQAPSVQATDAPAPVAQSAVPTAQFFNEATWMNQVEQMKAMPVNPEAKDYEQMIPPVEMVDTTEFKKDGPWEFCFSNASIANTWRVTGFAAMQEEVKLHPEIGTFSVVDAQERAEKQISDIETLLTRDCDIIIISPVATEALTPAVERAAATGIPVVVFDRGVNTEAMTTFVTPVGGYAYGAAGAQWLVDSMGGRGNMLVLRVLPGVDVLENRWAAARAIIEQYPDINVLGVEFTEHDPAKAKAITLDYIQRYGQIDGIYADFGGVGVAIYEAFQEVGVPLPPMTAEDYNGWLKVWAANKDTIQSLAPTNPTYQWRTAILAAVKILKGEEVPAVWTVPQHVITNENLDQYVHPELSDDLFVDNGSMDSPDFVKQFGGQ